MSKNAFHWLVVVLLAVLVSTQVYSLVFGSRVSKTVQKQTERLVKVERQLNEPNYEYKCVQTHRRKARSAGLDAHLDERFTELGGEGWKMVGYAMNDGMNARHVCFQRRVSE